MRTPSIDEGSRRRNRPATEDALIDAAREEFSAKGYAASTTRAIAAGVGCSDALIQNYFGGKEGLLAAVLGYEAGTIRAASRSLRRTTAGGPPAPDEQPS